MPTTHRAALVPALLALACNVGDETHATVGLGSSGDVVDPVSPNPMDTSTTANSGDASAADATDTSDDAPGIKLDVAPWGDAGPTGEPEKVSYIWVPNSASTTVSKVNTVTGVEEARYHTNGGLGGPSSIAIDQHGDLLVASTLAPHGLTKIAGSNCPDRNGDGTVQTSTGPDDVLPWMQDECVLWEMQVPQGTYNYIGAIAWEGGSCIDEDCTDALPNPRAWAARRSDDYRRIVVTRLDGATGSVLDQLEVQTDGGLYTSMPYHGAVNAEGDFWLLTIGGSLESPDPYLIHIDSVTLAASVFTAPQNGTALAVDAAGDPWLAGGNEDGKIWRFDTASSTFVQVGGTQGGYSGAQLDGAGRLWVASHAGCSLTVVDAATDTVLDEQIVTPNCVQHIAVSVDHNGYVWVVDDHNNATGDDEATLHKIDPTTHETVFIVEGFAGPNVRSDLTGTGLQIVTTPAG